MKRKINELLPGYYGMTHNLYRQLNMFFKTVWQLNNMIYVGIV